MKRSVFFLGLAFAGCAVTNYQPPPVSELSSSGIMATKLEDGRAIFTRNCTACHSAHPVSQYSIAEWSEIIADMTPRAKLSAEKQSALLAYLTAARNNVTESASVRRPR